MPLELVENEVMLYFSYIGIFVSWIVISVLSTVPIIFWGNSNNIYFYMKLPYLGFLINTLSYMLVTSKLKAEKHVTWWLHIALFISSYILMTGVIEAVFYAMSLYANYEDNRIAPIATNLPFLAGIATSCIFLFIAF